MVTFWFRLTQISGHDSSWIQLDATVKQTNKQTRTTGKMDK